MIGDLHITIVDLLEYHKYGAKQSKNNNLHLIQKHKILCRKLREFNLVEKCKI